ncbi:MAG TPA: NUDIX hydrolase [Candidatus Acidoferrum sp.]|nr:NUDIX hydrolase [Candidatus Acidoferrum sp.]
MANEPIKQNVVKALIIDDGKILFLWDPNIVNRDKWEVPGGRKRVGESDEESLMRETMEEAGIKIKVDKLIDEWEQHLPKKGWLLVGKSYLCTALTRDVKLEDLEKQHTAFRWVDIDTAKSMDLTDWLKRSLSLVD